MIIKESKDVARMLFEKYGEIAMLGPNKRRFIVNQICELYHEIREAERCRIEYGFSWTTDKRKEKLKREFKEHINYAEHLADFIDRELERTGRLKEAIAKEEQDYWDKQNAIINGEDED